jgi:broad specificity phosphatase PhoE
VATNQVSQGADALTSALATPLESRIRSLWLIRHAEVEPNYQSVFGGRIDMELSPRGHQQAEVLARYIKPDWINLLYASPMRRVQQTLVPLLKKGMPAPSIVQDLREVDFGDWTGCTWEQVSSKFGISPYGWLEQLDIDAIPNAESGARLRARLHPVLKRILESHPDQNVGLVCHGGVIRMLLSILFDLPFSRMGMFEVEYASITQVRFQAGKTQLHFLNFTPWRDLH